MLDLSFKYYIESIEYYQYSIKQISKYIFVCNHFSSKQTRFNGGAGAILCSSCYIILASGREITDLDWKEKTPWWCLRCVPNNATTIAVFINTKLKAVKEIPQGVVLDVPKWIG